MSDDLISRKAVLDYLKEQNNNLLKEKQKNGFVVSTEACRGMESALIAFRSFILAQPMAFDKEKMIVEFRKRSHNFYPSIDHYCLSQKAMKLNDAIRIVEKGGIE